VDFNDEPMVRLRAMVRAAHEDFSQTMAFHESWLPMLFDEDLRARMGVSLATNTFGFIRVALRREVILGLMRVWDNRSDSIKIEFIAARLREAAVIEAIATRGGTRGDTVVVDAIKRELMAGRDKTLAIIDKYSRGGQKEAVLEGVRALRNRQLAHRHTGLHPDVVRPPDTSDKEVDELYADTLELVPLLLHVVLATAYDPHETAEVFQRYAEYFWAPVRGERTEGHPNYRPLPDLPGV